MKIKIFSDFMLSRLEDTVNEWLKKEKVKAVNITQSITQDSFIITILYKE